MHTPGERPTLSTYLVLLPANIPAEPTASNWQRSTWMKRAPGIGRLPLSDGQDDHFR